MSKDSLKSAIDRMVEDAIRRILPGVMNEVLLKTIANSGVVNERAPVRQQAAPQQQRPAQRKMQRPSSLNDILDESAGSDFYSDPRAAMAEATREEEAPTPRGQVLAQRIQGLPAELRSLAEGMDLSDDGGGMWEDDSDSIIPTSGNGPPLDQAAKAVGLDFSRMRQVANVTESKKKVAADDRAANAQFEALRLKRMREQLNGGKPIE